MQLPETLPVRLIASRHAAQGGMWQLYLVNDSAVAFDAVRLEQVNYFAGSEADAAVPFDPPRPRT